MNRSGRRASPIVLALGALVLGAAPVHAATDGTVGVTITVAAPCILVSGSFDFGTNPFSQPGAPTVVGVTGATATNCSGAAETYVAHGANAVATTDPGVAWSLGSDPCTTTNQYRLDLTDANPVTTSVILGNTDQSFLTGVPDATLTELRGVLVMPCTGSDGAGLQMTSTVTITATL